MILTIDTGNTNISVGIFNYAEDDLKVVKTFRLATRPFFTTDEIGTSLKSMLFHNGIKCSKIKGVVISSVVPKLNFSLNKMTEKYFDRTPLFVSIKLNLGIVYRYKNPYEIGADRLVNLVAVNELYKTPAIIVDFGTATTFCVLSRKSEYLGGVIVPGIKTSFEALMQKAAKLPKVELKKPKRVIGKTTKQGMQSGIYHSTMTTVEGIISYIKKETETNNYHIVGTGGFTRYLSSKNSLFDVVDPILTLKGLKIIYHKNMSKEL